MKHLTSILGVFYFSHCSCCNFVNTPVAWMLLHILAVGASIIRRLGCLTHTELRQNDRCKRDKWEQTGAVTQLKNSVCLNLKLQLTFCRSSTTTGCLWHKPIYKKQTWPQLQIIQPLCLTQTLNSLSCPINKATTQSQADLARKALGSIIRPMSTMCLAPNNGQSWD